jgi:conserved hypothetical protein
MDEELARSGRGARLVKAFLLLAVGVTCYLLFARSSEAVEIPRLLGSAKPNYLFLMIILHLLTNALRAARLHVILHSTQPFRTTFHICNVGYLTNSLLPLRAGEFCMAALLAKGQPNGGGTALSKLLVDRMLDLLILTAFFQGALLFLIPTDHVAQQEMNAAVVTFIAVLAVSALLIGCMALETFLARKIEALGRRFGFNTTVLIATLRAGIEGIHSLFRKGVFVLAILLTGLAWICGLGVYLAGMMALNLPPLFACSILAMCFTVAGLITIPLPAGVGTTHGAIIIALTLFGINFNSAFSYAILYHALTAGINISLGLVGLKSLHLDLRGLRKLVHTGVEKR